MSLSDRGFAALALGAIIAAGLAASPALSAADSATSRAQALSAIAGRFTPASGEPALLARFARLSNDARSSFRFTPALPRSTNRAVTLVRRAVPQVMTRVAQNDSPVPAAITVTPVSYRLGSAVGYSAFTTGLDSSSVNIASLPAARAPVDVTVRPSRFGADMRVESRPATAPTARLADPERIMSVDVSGSYRLRRNIDLTAGVRLQSESDRLAPVTAQQQDSQAVYVGTRFRF